MDQPALFLVEADEKLQSKFNSLPNDQMTYNLLSSFIVGYIFALRPNKDLDDFDFILNTITNLLEVKQNKKLTFSQFILVMEQIIIKHSQNIQEIVIQESNKFCEAQQSKKSPIQIGSFQEEIEKVQQFFAEDKDLYNNNNNSNNGNNNSQVPLSDQYKFDQQNSEVDSQQFVVKRVDQRRLSLISRIYQKQMQEIKEETDDELGLLNEVSSQSQKEFSNYKIGNCDICQQDIKLNQYQPLSCLHNFHRDCLADKIINQFEIEKYNTIRCYVGTCNKEISDQEIQETLPQNKFQSYLDFKFDEFRVENNIIYCPSQDCNMRYLKEDGDVMFSCSCCKQSYCLNCKCKWHPNLSCAQYQNIHSKYQETDTVKNQILSFYYNKQNYTKFHIIKRIVKYLLKQQKCKDRKYISFIYQFKLVQTFKFVYLINKLQLYQRKIYKIVKQYDQLLELLPFAFLN
ncbi:Ibr domain protein (macronuclear) [Tetrahymena thermophila SB210]|uniref:RBR-type E3 ubiquitin transferase n=1 Tax=Tetrahymena thermophila (strain SB210) TaxID=312017 RepID=Q247S4_TETTS|nr:Ibr domain protein [Tetrahymena thermophila SB210]EAS04026.2 Ibr domain protein [Tetrahymena thermophila SB210]|eukprot:XP_001024271.2 Ibr domain protein [Tetrahymena thermophila SB210]